MKYFIDLNNRPFEAIKKGSKKVEGRVPTSWDKTPFHKMKKGDVIVFKNNESNELMDVKVLFVHHYKDVRSMLTAEGTANVLSGGGTIEEGIARYNRHEEYEKNIPKFGIYGIGVRAI